MSTTLNSIARIALAGAICDTYYSNYDRPKDNPKVDGLMKELRQEVEKAFMLWDRVTSRGLVRIASKINTAKQKTMLSKPRSIITFLDFAIAILDEPARKCKGVRKEAILRIIGILVMLRSEIGGKNEYTLSSIAAAKAADIWDGIEI